MTGFRKLVVSPWMAACIFFIAYFLYFAIFNRYQLTFQEQIQLFRFDWNYFSEFLSKPGGLSGYLGAFLTQFYVSPLAAILIVTLAGIAVYSLLAFIFKRYNIPGIIWPLIPVLFLLGLQSDFTFTVGYLIGLLLALSYFAAYISIRKDYIRYITGFSAWFILYMGTGVFSFLPIALCIVHELIFTKTSYRTIVALGYALMAAALPYLAWKKIYFIPVGEVWLNPLDSLSNIPARYGLILLLTYFPVFLIISKIWFAILKKSKYVFRWNWKTISAGAVVSGIVIFLFLPGLRKLRSYNMQTEAILGIDNMVQNSEWTQVLKLSSRYKKTEPLVTFFTNLALCKTGELGNRMFWYNQIGPTGLFLKWQENNITPFFGSEVFYQLGYINEAYRWSFEAMVASGQSPRLLKRLVMTSLINGKNEIAGQYLNVLDQTLFYKGWSQHYRNLIDNPDLLLHDQEIAGKRHLLIQTDFFADLYYPDFNLNKLLESHPENKMAFEYLMASLLLEKNLNSFIANINRLKDYGYKEIPVHYEEALLIYMANENKNVVPEGYKIRESTIRRFNDYINIFTPYYGNPKLAAQVMRKVYGNTYWFYSQFY